MIPKKVGLCLLVRCLMKKDLMGLKNALHDIVTSWIIPEPWKLVWKGRVSLALETLAESHPRQQLFALAIKGGPMCDWELAQLSRGGELRNRFPKMNLIIFKDANELVQALDSGTLDSAASTVQQ